MNDNVRLREQLHAIGRISIVLTILGIYSNIGAWFLVKTDPAFITNLEKTRPLLADILLWLYFFRYAVIPLFAIGLVTFMAGRFVEEIYGLAPWQGLRFMRFALFGIGYPNVRIRRGQMTARLDNIELLQQLGGPTSVIIQADTAVLSQRTRTAGRTSTNRSFFMAPFERIDRMISLEDQEGVRDEIKTVTRDGIQVTLTDVRYRFRILPDDADGKDHVRSIERPYSYDANALREIAYNASGTSSGEEDTWDMMVGRMVAGHVVDFINLHTIDYLTAPRRNGRFPRDQVNQELFTQVQNQLQGAGAQLLWIDVGHILITDPSVDQGRVDLWAADWAGNAQVRRAYADASRSAYHDLGRAEAQAQLIVGITRSLQGLNLNALPRDQLAAMLLVRTAQLLEGFSRDRKQNPPQDQPK